MKCSMYFLLLLLALCMVIDAKPKKTSSKFEGDFEFVDEVSDFGYRSVHRISLSYFNKFINQSYIEPLYDIK